MLLELIIGKMILGALVGGAAVGVAAVIVAISYTLVQDWIKANSKVGDTVVLTQKEINNAKTLNIGIFRQAGLFRKEQVASGSISGDKLDAQLTREFNGRTKIKYKV